MVSDSDADQASDSAVIDIVLRHRGAVAPIESLAMTDQIGREGCAIRVRVGRVRLIGYANKSDCVEFGQGFQTVTKSIWTWTASIAPPGQIERAFGRFERLALTAVESDQS